MKLIVLSLIAAAGFGVHSSAAVPSATPDREVPARSWAPLDTADSLWRRGRIAVADEAWSDAAWHFERLVDRYPASAYAGDALYWRAFALQRVGGTSNIREAVRALEVQKEKYPKAATLVSGEAGALMTRLNGRLARSGDSDAAMAIAEIASAAASIGAAVAEAVGPMAATVSAEVAREMAAVAPEIRAEMAREMAAVAPEIRAEMAREMAEVQRDLASTRRAYGTSRRGDRDDVPAGCEDVITDERIEALNALLQMNADQALPILKRVLERRDRCSEVLRRKAVFLVSQKKSEEAVDILVDVARNDPDAHTRSEAVFWLSNTRSERAVDVLQEILATQTTDEDVQKRAIFALAQTRSPKAAVILKDYVKRTDAPTELRGEAIFWLGQQRGAETSEFLKETFPTLNDDELREKVLFSLAQRRNEENAKWLLARAKDRQLSGKLRKSALFWAGQSGASTKDLGEIYDTSPNDAELREQVIFALSQQQRRDSAALDKLIAIARTEPDPKLRKSALFWVGQSKDPRATALFEEIINKPF
jgi:HEAT repeat protein